MSVKIVVFKIILQLSLYKDGNGFVYEIFNNDFLICDMR